MPELVKKAAVWLGLVTDDRYDEEAPEEEYSESVYIEDGQAGAEQPPVRELAANEAGVGTGASTTDVATKDHPHAQVTQTADLARIISVRPRTYNEARTIGEAFRDGTPVIMNLTDMDDSDAKRLVDFAAGLIFGLHGSIERVTSKVFLLSPRNVNVTAEDKQRLATSSFFNQS